jgi:hypothetical protein
VAGFLGEAILLQTIREWASSECDPYPCGMAVWRYVNAVSGLEPPALPDHQERKAMQTLLREEGGLEPYARSLMATLPWREINLPDRGDVGVVEFPEMGLTCAICLGHSFLSGARWMAKGAGFVLTLPAPHRAAWRVTGCLKP